ncbi:hypothetical protein [Paenibacillus guangzhouensis]|uniref:hypothetical protein n=1 Tax=Paenibacillus guangzhouensis TaxID=1473112 RepID=UPI001266D5A4|nr:hypothetical protein [Paenibacillus guangzhouensis]
MKRRVYFWGASIIIFVVIGILIFINLFPEGILLKNGIYQGDIKLIYNKDNNFRYYLYENNKGKQGVIALQKNSLLWGVYYKNEVFVDKGNVRIIKSIYPSVEKNNIVHKNIWGGIYYSQTEIKSHSVIRIDQNIVKTLMIKNTPVKSYFFIEDVNDLANNKTIITIE